jgi:hypothetical protein
MATFRAREILQARRARPVHDGLMGSVSGTITIPSGTLIGAGDVIRLFRVEASKIIPVRVIVDIGGNLDGHATPAARTLTGDLGYLRSADRSGTNLSFAYDTTVTTLTPALTTTPATEDVDALLLAATTPIVAGSVVNVTAFGITAAAGQLANGGVAVYNNIIGGTAGSQADSWGKIQSSNVQNLAYNANVMDVAITTLVTSSTATTFDIPLTVTVEFFPVTATASTQPFYIYRDRYSGGATGTF